MNIKLELPHLTDLKPRLTVIGVGGAGCNAINNMIAAGLTGVEFVVANTDAQTLEASSAEHRIQLGMNLTEGLGAGANPEIGAAAAEEAIDDIKSQISGSHMVFLAAGMGGGTGTGAMSIIARASREMGILTVGVVTKPFQFEGSRRMRMAEAGIADLRQHVDTMIVIPNQNLFRVANEKTTFAEAFLLADQVLYSGVACIVDLIVREGLINLDFADVRAVMRDMGTAMMGTGEGAGERRAITAAEEAIANPLLDDVSLQGAKGLLLSITGGPDLTLYEVDEAASRVRKEVDPEANIIVGATFDESLEDRVRVSIVASGMGAFDPIAGAAPGSGGFQPVSQPGGIPARPGGPPNVPRPPPVPTAGNAAAASSAQTTRPVEDLFRSTPPAAAPRSGAPLAPHTPAPPRQQPSPHAQHGAADDQRPAAVPAVPAAVPDNNSALWRSPEGVTINPGPAALQARQANAPPPPPAQTHAPEARSHATFEPRQTEDIHRKTQRMPDVEDFPAVGQREYYAKRSAPQQAAEGNSPREPQRKQGLFQRITGFGRRQGDSPAEEGIDKHSPVTEGDTRNIQPTEGVQKVRRHDAAHTGDEENQGVELPVFFSHGKGQN